MMRRSTSAPKPGRAGAVVHLTGRGRVDAEAEAHAVVPGQVARRLGGVDEVVGGQPVDDGRHRDLVDLGPGLLEGVDGLAHPGHHVGLDALGLAQLGHDPDAQPGDTLGEAGTHVRHGLRDRRGVAWIVPGDGLVERSGVGHGAAERSDLVERAGERHQPVAGHPAVGGLHAHDAAQRRGLADRPAGVGAERQRGEARGHRRRRAARRPARDLASCRAGCGSGRTRSSRWSCPWRTRRGWSCRSRWRPPRPASRPRWRRTGGRQPSRIRDEQVVGMPAVQMLSFRATGTPASGPGSSPAATRRSMARAARRASSASTRLKAWISPSRASMAARCSSTTSAAGRLPARTAAAMSSAVSVGAVTGRPPAPAGRGTDRPRWRARRPGRPRGRGTDAPRRGARR